MITIIILVLCVLQNDAGMCQLLATVLQALQSYVDWIPIKHIIQNNGLLLQMLVVLLMEPSVQNGAVDVLVMIGTRKVGDVLEYEDGLLIS